MSDEDVTKVLSGCGWLIAIVLFGCAIAIGIATQSFWVGIGVWFSLAITIGGAVYYVMEDDFKTYLWTWGSFIMLLALYAKYGALGHWWWMAGWLLSMFAHGLVGIYAREQKRPFHGMVAGLLALLSAGAGFSKPSQVTNILEPTGLLESASPPNPTIVWTWVLLILGLSFLFGAWVQGYLKTEGKPFVWLTLIGLGLLVSATWLSGLRGGWWWLAPWGLAVLMLAHAAHELREYYEEGAGAFGYLMTGLSILITIGIVLSLSGRLPEQVSQLFPMPSAPLATPAPTQLSPADVAATQLAQAISTATAAARPTMTLSPTPALTTATPAPVSTASPPPSGEQAAAPPSQARSEFNSGAVWEFLWTGIKSIWGIFHLIVLFMIGQLWLKRWGGILALTMLLAAVWIWGRANPAVLETMKHVISSSPATWMYDLITLSVNRWGTAGWGLLLLGMVVPLVLFQGNRLIVKYRIALQHLPLMKQLLGSAQAYRHFREEREASRMGLATILNLVVSIGLFVSLWVGLRQAERVSGLALGFLWIPDLSVPSWRPVWHWSYFALAGLFGILQGILSATSKKHNAPTDLVRANAWGILFSVILIALLVPAGVVLFLLGQCITQLGLLPFFIREARKERERKRREILEPIVERVVHEVFEEELRQAKEKRGSEKSRVPEPQPLRKPLYDFGEKSVGLALGEADYYAVLGASGNLFFGQAGGKHRTVPLDVSSPCAVLPLKGDEFLVVGEKNALRVSREGSVQDKFVFSVKPCAFALNPFKTMLAYLDPASQIVEGVFLERKNALTFASGLPLSEALAFSPKGSELAVGSPAGIVHILNVASRQKTGELRDPSAASLPVTLLAAESDGCWLVVYDRRRLVRLSAQKGVEKSIGSQSHVLSLAVCPTSGRIATGQRNGSLRVLDRDFTVIFNEKICEEPLLRVSFASDGSVVALSEKGKLWKIAP